MTKKLTAEEDRFLRNYVELGATDDQIRAAEKKARLRAGTGKRLLKRKAVQESLDERTKIVMAERERQQMVGAVVAQVTEKLEAENSRLRDELSAAKRDLTGVMAVPRMRIDREVLDDRLMRLVVGLDVSRYPAVIHDAIKTAYVIEGLLEQGTTKRVVPPDLNAVQGTTGIYASVFDRMRLDAGNSQVVDAQTVPKTPSATSEEIFDLTPVPPATQTARDLPPEGESILPVKRMPVPSRVMTVEIG